MADQNNSPTSIRYTGGLFKDTSHLDQPIGTIRYAKNAVMNQVLSALSNEEGNVLKASLPVDSVVIGAVSLTDNRVVLFLKIGDRSEVGLYKGSVYQTVLNPLVNTFDVDTDMNFSLDYPIEGQYTEQSDRDLVVYWTDDFNPPRALNITRQLESNTQHLYGVNPADSPDTSYIDRLNLFPHSGPVPHAELKGVNMGGECKTGVYYLALRYTDDDLTSTNFVTVTNPVSVVGSVEGVLPIESYDGDSAGSDAGKSITWTIKNINTDYKYLSAAVVFDVGEGKQARLLKDIEITDRSEFEIVFAGEQNSTEFSLEEVVIDAVSYTKAKTLTQLDNVMYLGNLESERDLGYQKYANFIKTDPVVKVFSDFDPFVITPANLQSKIASSATSIHNGYRDPLNIYKYKGYTREEVYAFYIAFILKNGEMSYAYHIPGRRSLTNVPITEVPELHYSEGGVTPIAGSTVNEASTLSGGGSNEWMLMNITGGWQNPLSHFFHWYDFSQAAGSRGMNYWENRNELYPNTDNYDVVDAYTDQIVDDIRTENIRHHRFPSNLNPTYTTVKGSNAVEVSQTLRQQGTKLVVNWVWYNEGLDNHFADQGGPMEQVTDYEISDIGIQFQGLYSEESDVDNWAPNMQDNANWWPSGPNNTSCFPPKNLSLDFPQINDLNNALAGTAQNRYNVANGEGQAFVDSGWQFGCGGSYTDVEFRYARSGPPKGANVILGWNKVLTGAPPNSPNCGNICLGTVPFGPTPDHTRIVRPEWANNWPHKNSGARPGWIAWGTCAIADDEDESAKLDHEVQALGFKLSDLKIPRAIADKVQGFRIYYANRTHDNRTVLGQNPIHPMPYVKGADLSGCNGGGIIASAEALTDYYLATGLPSYTDPNGTNRTWALHDFYLLNRRPSLSSATHIKLQYTLNMLQFRGNIKYYSDVNIRDEENGVYPCVKPEVYTGFFASGVHNRIPNYLLNFTIKDKAKAYINGNTFGQVKHLGFKHPIYNINGESLAAIEIGPKLPKWLVSGFYADWRGSGYSDTPANNSEISFDHYTQSIEGFSPAWPFLNEGEDNSGLMLYMANLKAFKTDLYEAVDTQDLVWTGFEILGNDLNNFIVDSDYNGNTPDYTTETVQSTATSLIYESSSNDRGIFGGDTFICRHGYRMTSNEQKNSGNPNCTDEKSVVFTVVESTDNINFRHIESVQSFYFPGAPLSDMLNLKANVDLSYNPDVETGNMKYNEAYAFVNDVKTVLPLPTRFADPNNYPTRVIRSSKDDGSSLIDAYRIYRALQYRTLPTNRGELWKLSPYNNLLLFHMEDSIYRTKGKQRMKLDDGTEAYVGSGDIFAQDPDELRPTDSGYMGTKAQRACIVTPYGYFFPDIKNRRIFYIGTSGIYDLTSPTYGMQRWFQDNIPFALEQYGFDGNIDNPISGMGFHAVWDERYSRVILTKRDIKPTQTFIDDYSGEFETTADAFTEGATGVIWVNGSYYRLVTEGASQTWETLEIDPDSSEATTARYFERTGWTISFTVTPERQSFGVWTSFHDYIPYIYSYSGIDIYSFTRGVSSAVDRGIYKHNNDNGLGKYYGTIYDFEIEIVHNLSTGMNSLFYSLDWTADVLTYNSGKRRQTKDLNAGFTSFMVYNSDAHSGQTDIEYMINTRKTGGSWKVNQFRDMSLEVTDTSIYYTGPFTGSNYGIVNTTVAGTSPAGVPTATPLAMFNVDGMDETFNTNYLDLTKPWNERGKFIDRFLTLRLIYNNEDNNLINLYNTQVFARPQNR